MDTETHRLIRYLITEGEIDSMDAYNLGFHDIHGAVSRAMKHGYKIKKETKGIWNRNTIYYLMRGI